MIMKKHYSFYVIAGLFCAVIMYDVCAMDEDKKSKEHPAIEQEDIPNFKISKLLQIKTEYFKEIADHLQNIQRIYQNIEKLDNKIEYLASIKKFPLIIDFYSGIPWAPLDPDVLKLTQKFKHFENAWNISRVAAVRLLYEDFCTDYGPNYEEQRFNAACALLAEKDKNIYSLNNYFCARLLCYASYNSDYWLVYIALLCGIDPNVNIRNINMCIGEMFSTPLQCAKTVKMAELLINSGAKFENIGVLWPLVKNGNWQLLKFYFDKNVTWKIENHSLFHVLMNLNYKTTFLFDSPENALKTLKVLFLAGYRNEDHEIKKIRKKLNKTTMRGKAILMKACNNPDFCLQQYLHFLQYSRIHIKEQQLMYNFVKYNNQTDVSIAYL